MDELSHVIDPDGEVKILLSNANAPFAVWDEPLFSSKPGSEGSKATPWNALDTTPTEGREGKDALVTDSTSQPPEEDQTKRTICIQASAKHLALVSPLFIRMLVDGWKEGITLSEKGSVEITADGWDTQAFLILLKIMHCQHHDIPRQISVEMLAKIAVISDYYECKPILDFFVETWIKPLVESTPTTYSRDLLLWIWISWYFRLPTEFQKVTSVAMGTATSPTSSLGLPVPGTVLDKLNERREHGIENILSLLQVWQQTLIDGSRGCSFECSSIMLGALIKQMHSKKLLSAPPVAPFTNFSYWSLRNTVQSLRSPVWRTDKNMNKIHNCRDAFFCSFFAGKIDIQQLSLESFTT